MMRRTHLQEKPIHYSSYAPTKSRFAPRPFASPGPENEALDRRARLGHSFGEIDLLPIQPKPIVGPADDKYEREADQVAEQVMRMPETCPKLQIKSEDLERLQKKSISSLITPLLQRASDPAKEETLPEYIEEELLQTKATDGQVVSRSSPIKKDYIQSLKSDGQTLSDPDRAFFEPRFGRDFSQVRLHTGPQAAETARKLNARAFTLGQDIVFGDKQYAPGTAAGRRLLAHELTHVVQQNGAYNPNRGIDDLRQCGIRRDFVFIKPSSSDLKTIRRVRWHPNRDTGRDSLPWGTGPSGDVLEAATDAGTSLDIWRPHDGFTYWCHGYTFGGSIARGGPYSVWGHDVPTILMDDGWRPVYSCLSRVNDILVFYDEIGGVTHTGVIRGVSAPSARIDESSSRLQSKWGAGSLSTSSWLTNSNTYGRYKCFSKSPSSGPCSGHGPNELI